MPAFHQALKSCAVLLFLLLLPIHAAAEDEITRPGDRMDWDEIDANFDELSSKLTLIFVDALTGGTIGNASVTLEGATKRTDSRGKVSFQFPKVRMGEGHVKAAFRKRGYVACEIDIHIMAGTVFNHRYSISPALPSGRYRIVLDWGEQPKDLDAHLIKQGRYHISYRDMKQFEDKAILDRDDTDGKGPETVTINYLDTTGHYVYYVHDYTNRENGDFKEFYKSRARVMVFNDHEMIESFEVPRGQGRVWKVFEIKGAQIVPNSQMRDRIE
jgi:hypothetical protein